jgi:hypothetical protein
MLSLFAPTQVKAQFAPVLPARDLTDTVANQPQPDLPPPPGDGPNAQPVNPGDTAGAQAVPSGNANPGPSTPFPTGQGTTHSIVRIYVQEPNRGWRMVQTLRPDSLTPQQQGQVAGVLGVNINSGQPFIDTTVTNAQMAQLNNILFPYPQAQMNNGKIFINADTPAPGYPKEQPLYNFQGPLPTVKTFSRYLVILGVVSSCIFMALAGTSVVLGHPYGGSRAIGAAAGLMLLLMGYTIWKIVQMNTFNANSSPPAVIQPDAGGGAVNNFPNPNMPVVPNAPALAPRSPLPVQPLNGQ